MCRAVLCIHYVSDWWRWLEASAGCGAGGVDELAAAWREDAGPGGQQSAPPAGTQWPVEHNGTVTQVRRTTRSPLSPDRPDSRAAARTASPLVSPPPGPARRHPAILSRNLNGTREYQPSPLQLLPEICVRKVSVKPGLLSVFTLRLI